MTYNKETRAEEMEVERNEDINKELKEEYIREQMNEVESGSMDTWIGENQIDLQADFINSYNEEWVDFCKMCWKEHNEELI